MKSLIVLVFGLFWGFAAPADPLKVVTSFSILQNLVAEIGGDQVVVQSLIPTGTDPHGFYPRPSDVLALKNASLFFTSGLGLEPWSAQLWKASKTKAPLIDVSTDVRPLAAAVEKHGHAGHDHSAEHEHHHGPLDPHYWQDPARVRVVNLKIAKVLGEALPSQKVVFENRAAALNARILEIENATKAELAKLPLKNRVALSPHRGFQYLGQAFDVNFVSILGTSTGQDLSAQRLGQLQRELKAGQIHVAFFEKGHSPQALKSALQELRIPTGTLNSDSLSVNGQGAATYLEFLKSNTDNLVQAFREASSKAQK